MAEPESTLLTGNPNSGPSAEDQAAYDALSPEDQALANEFQTAVDYDALSPEDKAKAGEFQNAVDYEALSPEDKAKADEYQKAVNDAADNKGAPEKYETFTTPEGVELNTETMEAFQELAKANNMTQEQAQAFVDLQIKNNERMVVDQQKAIESLSESWVKEVKADEEIGGADYQEKVTLANRVVKTFGSEKLVELLNTSQLGNHPEVLRVFYKVSQVLSEDVLVKGTDTKPTPKPFFDHPSSKQT